MSSNVAAHDAGEVKRGAGGEWANGGSTIKQPGAVVGSSDPRGGAAPDSRLHPVAPLVVRRLTSATTAVRSPTGRGGDRIGGHSSGGLRRGVASRGSQDETVWDKPDEFLPSRWLMTSEEWSREQESRRSFSADDEIGGEDARGSRAGGRGQGRERR